MKILCTALIAIIAMSEFLDWQLDREIAAIEHQEKAKVIAWTGR